MAGTTIVLDSVAGITATTTTNTINLPAGAFTAANFFLDVTTASGGTSTWTVTLNYVSPAGSTTAIAATSAAVDSESTGLTELVKTSGVFDGAKDAIPIPNQVVYVEASGTDALTASVIAILAQ